MPVSYDELQKIQKKAGFARFIHTNLHMHTPATPWDWNAYDGQTVKAEELTPEKYFEELNKTSLELVAITDHNTVSWCEQLIKLAKDARKNGTSKLHILPGVEITTYEGPHIIAIFDEDKSVDEIYNMLIRLGLSGKGRKDDKVSGASTKSIPMNEVFEEIISEEGIIIAPHVHTKDGLWGHKQFRGRFDALNNTDLRILAAKSGDIKKVFDNDGRTRLLYKNMDHTKITNSFAFINVSDCHRLDDFELNTTWLKMSTPSLNGVRQIIYEPELRVSHRFVDSGKGQFNRMMEFIPPQEVEHPYIIGLAISGGMLDGQFVAFSPHQNSIIGKNYSGKSALIDCIRFVTDTTSSTNETSYSRLVERMQGIIGDGSQVRLYLQDSEGKIWGIERTLLAEATGKRKYGKKLWQFTRSPIIYRLIGSEFHRETDLNVVDVAQFEIYPQGEVVKIREDAPKQMDIIDTIAKTTELLQELSESVRAGKTTIREKLEENAKQIIALNNEIEELRNKVSDIPDIETEIERLEKLVNSPLLTDLKKWKESCKAISGIHDNIITMVKSASTLESQFDQSLDEEENSSHSDDEDKQSINNLNKVPTPGDLLRQARSDLRKAIHAAKEQISDVKKTFTKVKKKIAATQDECNARIKKIEEEIEKSGAGSEAEIVRRLHEKQSKLTDLKTKRDLIGQKENELDSLNRDRSELLDQYYDQWNQIHEARQRTVEELNKQSPDAIRVRLISDADTDAYVKVLENIVSDLSSQDKRMSNKAKQLDLIVSALSPTEFVQLIRDGDVSKLRAAVPGLTDNSARLLMGMNKKHQFELELCRRMERLEISYRREGDTKFTPIDGGLSGGEQALALISLAMVKKSMPLIIDQPEDELGQALITGELVEAIRTVKPHRQLIFVTHAPNIPVLADSEQIIYMEHSSKEKERKLLVKHQGALEDPDIVQKILEIEGGKLAIERRYERYKPVL